MTTIWLLRHAESANPTVFHGAESDEPLGPFGELQARTAADWFREKRPTAVVSSAMKRAIDTAAPIAAACQVPHTLESQLHERAVGVLGGTPSNPFEGPYAATIERWSAGDTAYTTPGAESYDALVSRLVPAFLRVVDAHAGGRVVVVAHGIVCKVLLLELLPGMGPRKWVDLGRVYNLATCELVRDSAGFRAESVLIVPLPVAALVRPDAAT